LIHQFKNQTCYLTALQKFSVSFKFKITMENNPQQNFGLTSNTSVTISMPNAESRPKANESKTKNQLVKEMDSNANQIKHLKSAAENYKFLLSEKEKTIGDLNVGIQLLKQSFRPLDDKIQTTRNGAQEKRAGELDMLHQKIKESEEWEKNFNGYISEYKLKIDGKNALLSTHRKNMAAECSALERRYHSEVENTKASLTQLDKVYMQVLAEHAKLSDEKKFQLEKMKVLKQEFNQMRDQLENNAAERTALGKQAKELDARILQLDEQARQERESPTLLKIEDNKRNLALRMKQISDAKSLRQQKNQTLAAQKTKLQITEEERDVLVVERKSLEKTLDEKMQELECVAAEIASKQAHLENTRERTEEFERQMYEKLDEARRKSECYSANLIREMEGRRKESVFFVAKQDARKRAEKIEMERTKEELRDEMQSLEQMMEVLRRGHQLEMEGKQRHYERLERDLQVSGGI
jgi:chromosome segregation ATPase